jgi:hypothetical protein
MILPDLKCNSRKYSLHTHSHTYTYVHKHVYLKNKISCLTMLTELAIHLATKLCKILGEQTLLQIHNTLSQYPGFQVLLWKTNCNSKVSPCIYSNYI